MASVPIRISTLTPSQPVSVDASIRGVVTLVWPYSSSTHRCALLVAEEDFRLRNKKGQVRVRFEGPAATAIAKSRVGVVDRVVLNLNGARWAELDGVVATPGKSVDGELEFDSFLQMQVLRANGSVDHVRVENDDRAQYQETGVQLRSTDGRAATPDLTPASSGALVKEPSVYHSPAFLRTTRLFDVGNRDLFDDDDTDSAAFARKRVRVSFGQVKNWKYAERTPSPVKDDGPEKDAIEQEAQEADQDRSTGAATENTLNEKQSQNIPGNSQATISSQHTAGDSTVPRQFIPRLHLPSNSPAAASFEERSESPCTPRLQPVSTATLPLPSPFPTDTMPQMSPVGEELSTEPDQALAPGPHQTENDEPLVTVMDESNDQPDLQRQTTEDVAMDDQVDVEHCSEASPADSSPVNTSRGKQTPTGKYAETFDHQDVGIPILDNSAPPNNVDNASIVETILNSADKHDANSIREEKDTSDLYTHDTDRLVDDQDLPNGEGVTGSTASDDVPGVSSTDAGYDNLDATASAQAVPETPAHIETTPLPRRTPSPQNIESAEQASESAKQQAILNLTPTADTAAATPQLGAALRHPLTPRPQQRKAMKQTLRSLFGFHSPSPPKFSVAPDDSPVDVSLSDLELARGSFDDSIWDQEVVRTSDAGPTVHTRASSTADTGSPAHNSPDSSVGDDTTGAVHETLTHNELQIHHPSASAKPSTEPNDQLQPGQENSAQVLEIPESPSVSAPFLSQSPTERLPSPQPIMASHDDLAAVASQADETSPIESQSQEPDVVELLDAEPNGIEKHEVVATPQAETSSLLNAPESMSVRDTQITGDLSVSNDASSDETDITEPTQPQAEEPAESVIVEEYHEHRQETSGMPEELTRQSLSPQHQTSVHEDSLPSSPARSHVVAENHDVDEATEQPEQLILPPEPPLTQQRSPEDVNEGVDTPQVVQPEVSTQDSAIDQANVQKLPCKRSSLRNSVLEQDATIPQTPAPQETPIRHANKRSSFVPEALRKWFTPKKATTTEDAVEDGREVDVNVMSNGHVGEVPTLSKVQQNSPPPVVRSNGVHTSHSYFTRLSLLDRHVNQPRQNGHNDNIIDVLAVATKKTDAPKRAKNGPRDYFTTFAVADDTLDDTTRINVEVYRPWKAFLPAAEVGDVVLLRAFSVKSKERQPYLLSNDESAWCVWRYSQDREVPTENEEENRPPWTLRRVEKGVREEVHGPPVEFGEGERRQAAKLRQWWAPSPEKRDGHDDNTDGGTDGVDSSSFVAAET